MQKPLSENIVTSTRILSRHDSSIPSPYHLHSESLYHRFAAKALALKYRHLRQSTLQARFVNPATIPFALRIAITSISCKSLCRKILSHPPEYSLGTIRHFRPHTICTQNRYIIDLLQKPLSENIATSEGIRNK